MPIVALIEFPPGDGVDYTVEYDRVSQALNGHPFARPSDWGEGMLAHVAAVREDRGALIIDVWEDQAAMDAWMERVGPYLEGMPEPKITALPTHNLVTAAPVSA
jgi:quinol monooxygenase YgiN